MGILEKCNGQRINAKQAANRTFCSLGILFNPEDGACAFFWGEGEKINFYETHWCTSQASTLERCVDFLFF
jgi:hypothetical protein